MNATGPYWWWVSIGPGNGRREAYIWVNFNTDLGHHMTSLGHTELNVKFYNMYFSGFIDIYCHILPWHD